MECLICRETRMTEEEVVLNLSINTPGICDSCRADAALGRAVRRMPQHSSLCHGIPERDGHEWLLFHGDKERSTGAGVTPEAALKAAGMMEVKE